jgi:hypothetical protein
MQGGSRCRLRVRVVLPPSSLTCHAEARLRQRGIRRELLELFLTRADSDQLVGDGCVAWPWSRTAWDRAKRDGVGPAMQERVRKLMAIVAEERFIITVMKPADPPRLLPERRWTA